MKTRLFGLAAIAAVGLSLLTGCPAEEKQSTGTASPAAETAASPALTGTFESKIETASAAPAATATDAAAASIDAKAIFAQKCSGCHGANGGGGMGPALGNVEAKGDEFIKHRIVEGSPTKGMPPFGTQLSPAELDALVAYVKTL